MDVKQLLDEKGRYVFLNHRGLVEAFPIIHAEESCLFFTSKNNLEQSYDSGYFLASGDSGIVQFENPVIESIDKSKEDSIKQKVHRINFAKLDFAITNRRLSVRYELENYVPILFYVYGDVMSAKLVNISEGGLRMCVDNPLQKNIRCHFEIRLPNQNTSLLFKTDGVVVYSSPDNFDDKPKQYMIGISFVIPELKNEQEKQGYINAKNELKQYVLDHYKE